ncbi:PstS family phosphate ABC transporter substrate-binding protein [Paenibacillus shenyangensis]|uniref:PstS family phosphate ABC transporter substrate-binding protein n=1 Tax=Paenibacillus sp. A9 TaxID=1284352 RepID=UPI0003651704|nr:PstS family phosphate ABC transporter substrate-binding protein [Paenibacillus sp. A9]
MERVMTTIGLALLGLAGCVFAGIIGTIVIGFTSDHPLFYTVIFYIILLILEIAFILSSFENILHHPLFNWLLVVCLAGCIVATASYKGYTLYDQSMVAVSVQDIDLQQYQPFQTEQQPSRVASLGRTSSYHLDKGTKLPRLDGATALYPVYSAFVQAVYPRAVYDPHEQKSAVQGNGTGPAYERLIAGNTDMIFAAAPSSGQEQLARQNDLELQLTPIGKEAFVFFVSKDNPVTNLTSEQIKEIYSGKITNWQQVGGKNESIQAFQRPEDSGSQAMLRRWMGSEQPMNPPTDSVASGMGDIMEKVASYRNYNNAIGYSFHFFATTMNPNSDIRLLAVDGVYPDSKSIANGTYKLIAPFYAVTAHQSSKGTDDSSNKKAKVSSNPNIQPLLTWILSPEGQELIRKTGYFPLPSQ